jgi:hypothetical protein
LPFIIFTNVSGPESSGANTGKRITGRAEPGDRHIGRHTGKPKLLQLILVLATILLSDDKLKTPNISVQGF